MLETSAAIADEPRTVRPPTPRRRKVLFVGNCQALALYNFYRLQVAMGSDDDVSYLSSDGGMPPGGEEVMRAADVLVYQVLDVGADVAGFAETTKAQRFRVPQVDGAGFLWPYIGRSAHPKHTVTPFLPFGAYGGTGLGDDYLNRMIRNGVDPIEAVDQYEALDIVNAARVDRLKEILMDRQRTRDEKTQIETAGLIEGYFRTEPVQSKGQPTVRVYRTLAEQLFEKMGVTGSDRKRIHDMIPFAVLDEIYTPIHPGIIRHFGLTYLGEDHRYPFIEEGRFTFREYCLRYMRYEYNSELAEGIFQCENGATERTETLLRAGVERSPESWRGHYFLARMLRKRGDSAAASRSVRRSLELMPHYGEALRLLAELRMESDDFQGAEEALRTAMQFNPLEPHYAFMLAEFLRANGRLSDAIPVLENCLAWLPYYMPRQETLARYCRERALAAEAMVATLKSYRKWSTHQ